MEQHWTQKRCLISVVILEALLRRSVLAGARNMFQLVPNTLPQTSIALHCTAVRDLFGPMCFGRQPCVLMDTS